MDKYDSFELIRTHSQPLLDMDTTHLNSFALFTQIKPLAITTNTNSEQSSTVL